jgi:hypothetical protein
MPRCKNGTRKNKKTGECETYTKPVSKSQRATKKMEVKAQEKDEEYKYRLNTAREEFFEEKQGLYDELGLLEDFEEITPKQKKAIAKTMKKAEALEKRYIRKYKLNKDEWVGNVEPVTVGMLENRPYGDFLKPKWGRR